MYGYHKHTNARPPSASRRGAVTHLPPTADPTRSTPPCVSAGWHQHQAAIVIGVCMTPEQTPDSRTRLLPDDLEQRRGQVPVVDFLPVKARPRTNAVDGFNQL